MEWVKLKFKFWMAAGNVKQYSEFLNSWFEYVRGLLLFPVQQFDAEAANIYLVDLLAWQRDIVRFNQEPEWLYRRRVKHAYANARDAGTAAGFAKIWQRMELGFLEIQERIDGRDWDIVELTVTESTIAQQPELLDIIIEKYGRTCRRYEWTTKTNLKAQVLSAHIEQESENITARI